MATQQGIQIVHFVPGRIRVKLDAIKGNKTGAEEIRQRLVAIDGITHISTNPVTGSVLLLYDPEALAGSWDSFLKVAGAIGLTEPGAFDSAQIEQWMQVLQNGTGPGLAPNGSATAAKELESLFGSLNARLRKVAKNQGELKDLVPLGLLFLGLRRLLVASQGAVPSWYNYFALAFGIFVALHPRKKDGRKGVSEPATAHATH